jgi:hypothetical protein
MQIRNGEMDFPTEGEDCSIAMAVSTTAASQKEYLTGREDL